MKRDREAGRQREPRGRRLRDERPRRDARRGAEERVEDHGDDGRRPEDGVPERDHRGVPHRVVRRVRDRAVRPEPRVPSPLGEAGSERVVIGAVSRRRDRACRPGDDREPDREADGGDDEPAAAPGGHSQRPSCSSATMTSHAGRPTTFEYEPSIRETSPAPRPWMA